MSRDYKICTRCIMDTTASDIMFDEKGVCNYCTEFISNMHSNELNKKKNITKIIDRIKNQGKNKEYDCILGLSGGFDSSYALYRVKKLGLKALAVHVDNAWNSELSVSNIEKLVKNLEVDLLTYVINWEEFKDLQISFFKANVIDIEMLTDHAIVAALYKTAIDKGLKYILAGTNFATEGMRMPPGWNHVKLDLKNIKAIHKKFGNKKKLKIFPTMGLTGFMKNTLINRIKWISIIDYFQYNKNEAGDILNKEIGWRIYEKKHYESVFTRFYQGYILPQKFHIDKRKLHYSSLICSGQMTRDQAMKMMEKETYVDESLLLEDKEYVIKKLGFTDEEFDKYIHTPPIPHRNFASNERIFNILSRIKRFIFGY